MNLYIYYRVGLEHAAAVQAGVAAMQAELRAGCVAPRGIRNTANCPTASGGLETASPPAAAHAQRRPGMRCGLQQRLGAGTSGQTWMEVYLDVPTGFEARLEAAWSSSAMPPLLDGVRHTEHFLDCLPCA